MKQELRRGIIGHGQDLLNRFGLEDYFLDEKFSNENHALLENNTTGEVKLVFRGVDASNPRPSDEVHKRSTILDKERDYGYLDELYRDIKRDYPTAPMEIVSYSNGGPKGLYLSEKYGVQHYSIDPLLGPKELGTLMNRDGTSPKLQLVRTTRPAVAMGGAQTLHEIVHSNPIPNAEILNVEPLPAHSSNPMGVLQQDHGLVTYPGDGAGRTQVTLADGGGRPI